MTLRRPALLGVQPLSEPPPYFEIGSTKDSSDIVDGEDYSSGYTDPHPDERQIKLDTDRSFVLYPPGEVCPPLLFSNCVV